MSFEAHLEDHIKELQKKGQELSWQRDKLLHSCDCEYCDYDRVEDDDQKEWDKITAEMEEIEKLIEKIKQHAKLHKIQLVKV